jgi:glycosyltransferase involved in cell wall biosynthesis
MITVAAIIPVRNRLKFTSKILQSLATQSNKKIDAAINLRIIVVDDGSTDGTIEFIEKQFSEVCLIKGDGSLWWTGAVSKGMKYAIETLNADYILWLNDDIYLPENLMNLLAQKIYSNPGFEGIIGGVIFAQDYPSWIAFGGVKSGRPIRSLEDFGARMEIPVDTLNGNLVLIPANIPKKIGLPDAKKFAHYGGDYEYFVRAKSAGFPITLCRDFAAVTPFDEQDVIRYMHPRLQWKLTSKLKIKFKILMGLTSLKTNYNIWHMVNSMNREKKNVHAWRYIDFYFRKIIQLLLAEFQTNGQIKQSLETLFQEQQIPKLIQQNILDLL